LSELLLYSNYIVKHRQYSENAFTHRTSADARFGLFATQNYRIGHREVLATFGTLANGGSAVERLF